MSIQSLYEKGKGPVANEYGRSEPIDSIVHEEQFRLETSSSHTQYLAELPLKSMKVIEAMQMGKEIKHDGVIFMRKISTKRNYTRSSDQDRVRFFKLLCGIASMMYRNWTGLSMSLC